jgi:hypothetical protein
MIVDFRKERDEQPHPLAMKEGVVETDVRAAEIMNRDDWVGKEFREIGKNHRELIDNGEQCVARDVIREEWVVHVYDLWELLDIVKETGGELSYDPLYSVPFRIDVNVGSD